MTSIGVVSQNFPTGRDLQGTNDQSGIPETMPAGADTREKSFESHLANFARSSPETTAASAPESPSVVPARVPLGANGVVSAGASQRGTQSTTDASADAAGLATKATSPEKTDRQSANNGPSQSSAVGDDRTVAVPVSDAASEPSPVTTLLGSLSQISTNVSANAGRPRSSPNSFAFGTNSQMQIAGSPRQSDFSAALAGQGSLAGALPAAAAMQAKTRSTAGTFQSPAAPSQVSSTEQRSVGSPQMASTQQQSVGSSQVTAARHETANPADVADQAALPGSTVSTPPDAETSTSQSAAVSANATRAVVSNAAFNLSTSLQGLFQKNQAAAAVTLARSQNLSNRERVAKFPLGIHAGGATLIKTVRMRMRQPPTHRRAPQQPRRPSPKFPRKIPPKSPRWQSMS